MKNNIGVIIDNDFYNDIRVFTEVKLLSEKFNVFVLCLCPLTILINNEQLIINNVVVEFVDLNLKIKNILFALQNSIPIYDYLWCYKIVKFIKKYNLISIHLHDLYFAKIGWMVKQKTGVKFILDLHENYPAAIQNYTWTKKPVLKYFSKPSKWSRIEKKLLSYPDKIIVTNDFYKEYLLDKHPALNKANVIVYENVPNISELKNYPIDLNIFPKGDKIIILYFGAVCERRGVLDVIKALKKLHPKYSKLHFLLIGPINKHESKVFEPHLREPFVTHIPWIDISFLPSYLSISDICICPLEKNEQHDTCFPNKIYQYALFGKPIIASNCLPQEVFIKDNDCGVVFDSKDINDLSNKIEFLVNNPDICKEYGEKGEMAIKNRFNTEVFKERLFSLFNTNL